jgi:acetyl esterase
VGYRLAPEHRFPVAVTTPGTRSQWLARRARAGPGHGAAWRSAATAPAARWPRSAPRWPATPAAAALQLLFYPGCAAGQQAPSHARYHQGLVLEQAHIEYFFRQYIDDADREDWRFAPLNTPDLEGVAPAWFGLAECDPLVDDGLAYADKLRAAGVPVDLEIYRGVTHEFIKMGRALPEARQAHADAAAALRSAFAP